MLTDPSNIGCEQRTARGELGFAYEITPSLRSLPSRLLPRLRSPLHLSMRSPLTAHRRAQIKAPCNVCTLCRSASSPRNLAKVVGNVAVEIYLRRLKLSKGICRAHEFAFGRPDKVRRDRGNVGESIGNLLIGNWNDIWKLD